MTERLGTAVVAGATGVAGRAILEHLATSGRWDCVALSRRPPDAAGRYYHIAVDLADPADCAEKLAILGDATHVFHAAYVERAEPEAHAADNLAMLRNLLVAIEPVAKRLRHVHLVEGTKWYGSHLGPFRTPAREDDPRPAAPVFYHAQQDLLTRRRRGKAWTWSAIRPHAVCGFSLGSAMNLVSVIAVYASVMKALGQPLDFPGTPGGFRALYQVTDARILARAVAWMATEPACADQAFNVTNGDLIRWENLWPRIADVMGMPVGRVLTVRLQEAMPQHAGLWQDLQRRHGLKPYRYEDLAAWRYGDAVFWPEWDIVSSTVKVRQAGFPDCIDSEAMLLDLLARYRKEKIVP
ncbi:MAG: SDR family oxidoreductase [Alphaproteobacteria bacterium]|nr:SDR family oxidoreductase [Alphaproteobacteria bacterium]